MARMMAFKDSCLVPTCTISSMLNKEREEQITRNTKVIKSLLDCVCFCAKQGLPFRGHKDDYTAAASNNKGTFFELVQFRAKTDDVLQKYLENSPRNAVYTSKTIQNELISLVGDEIKKRIIKDIQTAKYFSLLADEATDCGNLEQVSVVIRFVDGDKQIREEYLGFITV